MAVSGVFAAVTSAALGICAATVLLGLSVRLRQLSSPARLLTGAPGRRSAPAAPRVLAGWWERRRDAARRQRFDRAVLDWVDLLQMAAAAGMTLQSAASYTAPLADSPLREALVQVVRNSRAGGSAVARLHETLDEGGGQAAAQVAHLLSDSARRGLPLRAALTGLKADMLQQRRHLARRRLKTVGLKIAVGTVLFLFPAAFVVVIMPSLLTFFGW